MLAASAPPDNPPAPGSRDELAQRIRLAQSVLAHRPPSTATHTLLERVLDGMPLDALTDMEG